MRGVGVALAASVASLALAPPARAFTVEGHQIVEAIAYRRLLAAPAVDDGRGGTMAGKRLLEELVERGALETPPCFHPKLPSEIARCKAAASERPVVLYPVIGSGEPDLKSARQFGTNGQCFHFMARTEHVWGSDGEDPKLGVPKKLVDEAFYRCTRALGALYAESVAHPGAANGEYSGLYALMHAVADSFSAAHVERDADWNVLYLKPWRLRAVLPYAVPGRWGAYRYWPGPTHHGVVDERDDGYKKDDPKCADFPAPYAFPEACLSARGSRAADALVDLLVTVHGAIERADRGERDVEGDWRAYLDRNLHERGLAPDLRAPFWNEREWTPAFVFGARFRPRPVPGAMDATLLAGSTVFTDVTLPLAPFLSVEAGCRKIESRCKLVLGVDAALLLPLTEGFSLGVTPLSLVGQAGDGGALSIGANVIRADFFALDALWLSVAGPRYDSIHRAFDAELVTFTMGYAWSGKLGRAAPLLGVDDLRMKLDSRRFTPATDDGTHWTLPELRDNYRRASATVVIHILGGTVLPERSNGSYSVGGVEVLWDRDRFDRRAGFAIGGRVDTEYRLVDDTRYYTLLGGPVARAYLVPNRLALELAPLQVDGGLQSAGGKEDRFLDLGGEGSVAIMPLNRLEIGVESPRLSYRTGDRVRGTNLSLRVGFALQ